MQLPPPKNSNESVVSPRHKPRNWELGMGISGYRALAGVRWGRGVGVIFNQAHIKMMQ